MFVERWRNGTGAPGHKGPVPLGCAAARLARVSLAKPVVSLPAAESSPWRRLLARLIIATGLLMFVTIVAWLGRDGYRDLNETPVGFLDALYYSTVSITTTGYGDITPVTDEARLVTTLVITPARILFLIILVGTTIEVLAERTRTAVRERIWRSG